MSYFDLIMIVTIWTIIEKGQFLSSLVNIQDLMSFWNNLNDTWRTSIDYSIQE